MTRSDDLGRVASVVLKHRYLNRQIAAQCWTYPRIALYAGIAATIVLIACLLFLGWANGGSRNISLAVGTLLGAFILLGTQLAFELRSTETVSVFKTEFTTDNEQPKIEQFRYPMSSRQRPLDESEANKFLLETTPSAFKGDGEKLWKDMSLLSLVLYLWSEQHDWQIARDVLGGYERFQYQSKPDQRDQCTKVGWEMIQGMLRQANNAFADFKPTGLFQFMCLPPRSSIDVRPSTVLIKAPFCQIRFDIEELWISRHSEMPGTNDMPMTKDNRPRFETRTGIIRTTVKYDWILAQSREMPKHETWANDVVERARKWFDPEFPAGKHYIS